jgi:outer membrane protein
MKHNTYSSLGALAIAACITAVAPHAYAQKTRYLTLNEAIQLSIQTSGQLKIANAKVDEAIANSRDAWNNHLPDVKVTGAYLRLDNPNVDLKVKLGGRSSDTSKPASTNSIKVNQATYGIVNASLPLFSGFRIKYGVESAKYLEQAAKLDAEGNKEDITLNTINAYNNLYKAKKSVDLVKENLAQQKQRPARKERPLKIPVATV